MPIARVEKLSRSCGSARGSEDGFDAVTETAKFADHLRRASVCALFRDGWAAFFVGDTLVQDLPHEPAQPVGDGPDRLGVSEPNHESSIHELKDTPSGLDRRVGGLIEQATHLPIAMG